MHAIPLPNTLEGNGLGCSIVILRPRNCLSKSSKGCPSENASQAIAIISLSVVERATDVWRRVRGIGHCETTEERKLIMPNIDRTVCTHDATAAYM